MLLNVNGITLHEREIVCEVPQGSILGPLFFIIYINDRPKSVRHVECLLFADDNSVFYQSCNPKTLIEYLNDEICHVIRLG